MSNFHDREAAMIENARIAETEAAAAACAGETPAQAAARVAASMNRAAMSQAFAAAAEDRRLARPADYDGRPIVDIAEETVTVTVAVAACEYRTATGGDMSAAQAAFMAATAACNVADEYDLTSTAALIRVATAAADAVDADVKIVNEAGGRMWQLTATPKRDIDDRRVFAEVMTIAAKAGGRRVVAAVKAAIAAGGDDDAIIAAAV